jgi:hypothetical protein
MQASEAAMRVMRMPGETGRLRAIHLLLLGALVATGCESPRQQAEKEEVRLAAAGFVVRPANTPQRQAMLARLPSNRLVQRTRGDVVTYAYADPSGCNCLYVGSQQAYDRFQRDALRARIADQRETTAELYSDAAWDWNAWGPWDGPFFGPGLGW